MGELEIRKPFSLFFSSILIPDVIQIGNTIDLGSISFLYDAERKGEWEEVALCIKILESTLFSEFTIS